jgi:RNA polymerase sigma factor (sigma-70 family)
MTADRGDPAGQNELRRELIVHHDAAFTWAKNCCRRDRSEAEEVLHVSYLKVLEGRARFDRRSSFRTWLFGVIHRTAADHRRRRVLRDLVGWHWGAEEGLREPAPGADVEVEQAQRRSQLERALAALPRRQREVLQLVFHHELTGRGRRRCHGRRRRLGAPALRARQGQAAPAAVSLGAFAMTPDPEDRDLAERFAALRAHDLAEAPGFDVVWAKAAARVASTPRATLPMRALTAAGAAAVVLIGVWLVASGPDGSRDAEPNGLPGWRMPTDTLMAGTGDALHGPSWASLPTAGLGPFLPLDPSRENR